MKVILALIACMVALSMLELCARIIPVESDEFKRVRLQREFKQSTKFHPQWGWSFVPDADATWDYTGREREPIKIRFQTMPIPGYPDYGMRDDGLSSRAEQVIPILGDSFTFGATVERDEIWCELIEERNPAVDMLNLANGGGLTKACAQYEILRDLLPAHDVVIYEMWLGNEFFDNYAFPQLQPTLQTRIEEHTSDIRRLRLLSVSKVGFMAYSAQQNVRRTWRSVLKRTRKLGKPEDESLRYVAEADQMWDERYGNFYLRPRNPILSRYAEPEYSDERIISGVHNTEKALLDMKSLVGERELVVILFPFKAQLHEDLVKEQRPELDLDKPNRIVESFCTQHDVVCMDLLPLLRAKEGQQLYWDYDTHFTSVGQMVASGEVESLLRNHGIIR